MGKRKTCLFYAVFVFVSLCYVYVFVLHDHPLIRTSQCRQPQVYSLNEWYPSNTTIIDHPLRYMTNTDVCGTNFPISEPESHDHDIHVLILISSHPENRRLRDATRQGLTRTNLASIGGRRLFLLGKPTNPNVQASLTAEILTNRDILQGDFLDTYHNLTYKHLMGLQWATIYCPSTRFILKMDDDIAIDIFQLLKQLNLIALADQLFMAGFAFSGDELNVQRNPTSKWYLKPDEYQPNRFPSFLSGWMYLTNVATADAVVSSANQQHYFWIDDVYITGILRDKLNIPLVAQKAWFTVHEQHLKCCTQDTSHSCQHLVGPVNKDPELLRNFLQHSYACFLANCSQPIPSHSLKPCVTAFVHDRLLRDRGQAHIQLLE